MKSINAKIWLVVASLALLSGAPALAQDSTSTTTTSTVATPTDGGTVPATAKASKKLKKQRPVKAKKVKYKKHRLTGHQLSGGVSKKSKHKKTYKPISAKQQKRLDKLNAALSSPKQYKKIPELSSPGGVNSTPSAPGL